MRANRSILLFISDSLIDIFALGEPPAKLAKSPALLKTVRRCAGSEALELATKDKKRVLLVFGGNWCYDCHVLDRALHEGEAGRVMRQSFLLAHVDIGEGDKNLDLVKQYKTTLDKGVPIVVVLNRDGRLLYSSTEGEFEAARKMMKKDLVAFLRRWKQK